MADVRIYDRLNGMYDEAFKLRAVAIAHARSRSLSEVAVSLSLPAKLLEEWKSEYADRVKVRYIRDERTGDKVFRRPRMLERCDACGARVVFETAKTFVVQREKGVAIGTHDSIMNSGNDGIYGIKVPYVRITTEIIQRCPACGTYVIYNIIDKLSRSEVKNY